MGIPRRRRNRRRDGLTNTSTLEVPLKQAMIASARTALFVADSSKFGRRALVRVADVDQVHRIVTAEELAPEVAAQYGDRLLLVPLWAPLATDDASLVAS
jgi:DeoR family transcriptional regulator, aga operon transcriptional repressor